VTTGTPVDLGIETLYATCNVTVMHEESAVRLVENVVNAKRQT